MKTIDVSKKKRLFKNEKGEDVWWEKRNRDGQCSWCPECGEQVFIKKPIGNNRCPNCGYIVPEKLNAWRLINFQSDGHPFDRVFYQEDLDSDQVLQKMNELHKKRFYKLVEQEEYMDIYRETLFYIVAGKESLFKQVHQIYDFEKREISANCAKVFEGSSRALMELALQLYSDVNPRRSLFEFFRDLNHKEKKLAWMAIAIRYDIDID